MLDASSAPSWLRPLSLRWVDLSGEYLGAAARRLDVGGPCPRTPGWRRAWSDVIHSRRTLEGLSAAGVTVVCVHYDDGFGPATQAEDIRQARAFAATCRDLDLRVFARIEAGALYYETLLTDRPGLAAWAQRDPSGNIVPAGEGLPAWRPCYRSRGFLEMLKESVSVACEQLEADGVLLGGVGPHDCHCERCQHAFRRLLASRYPDPRAALGLPSLEHVRLPVSPVHTDPLHYEAAQFRVRTLAGALGEVRVHLRSISAHLALWAEPRPGTESDSCAAFWELCAPLDIVTWPQNPDELDGGPAALAARHLAGRSTRTFVHVPASSDATDTNLSTSLGTAMAFGGHVLANEGALRSNAHADGPAAHMIAPRFVLDEPMRELWTRLLGFAARHEHYHHRAESIAEVALVFSAADVAGDPRERADMREAQRALLEAALPFDVLPMESVDPHRHRVVVVAGQSSVLDDEAAKIAELAESGCALVLVGQAGSRDAHGRRRASSAFARTTGAPNVEVVPAADGEAAATIRARIASAVRKLLPHPPMVALAGPAGSGPVMVCPLRLPTGQVTFHLLNAGGAAIEGLRLHVRADLAPTRHVAWHHPESADVVLDSTLDDGSIVAALPRLATYALAVTS
jgi:hypothetical protein